MFRCPRNCDPECPVYDEKFKTCMHNTKIIELEEALEAQWTNPAACSDELD